MNPKKHRLSPSGPFLTDDIGGEPLQVGPGSPGLMWRAMGTLSAQEQAATTPVLITGLDALAWALPRGYHYDFQAVVAIKGTTAGPATVHIQVQESDSSWHNVEHGGPFEISVTAGSPANGTQVIIEATDVDRTAAAALDIQAVRVEVTSADNFVDPEHCSLRATQYVL